MWFGTKKRQIDCCVLVVAEHVEPNHLVRRVLEARINRGNHIQKGLFPSVRNKHVSCVGHMGVDAGFQ
jgi:hypothetical protein